MYYLLGVFIVYVIYKITGSRKSRMKWKIRKTVKYDYVNIINEEKSKETHLPYNEFHSDNETEENLKDYITESLNFKVENIEIQSKNVDETMSYIAIVPKDYDSKIKYPYIMLLHGLRDCGNDWINKARLLDHYENLLKKKVIGKMIIILPNSGFERRSWYSNFKKVENKRYESYFVDELIPDVKSRFNVKNGGVSGFSMGGYGAFKLGLKHLELFQVIGSFAGAVSLVRLTINKRITRIAKFIYLPNFLFKEGEKETFLKIFGSWGKEIMKEDPYTLIKKLEKQEQQKKHFYLSVGSEDKEPYYMVHQWVDMVGRIKRFNLPFEAYLYKGEGHKWEYVSKDLENFLKYSWKHLK